MAVLEGRVVPVPFWRFGFYSLYKELISKELVCDSSVGDSVSGSVRSGSVRSDSVLSGIKFFTYGILDLFRFDRYRFHTHPDTADV